MKISFTEIFYLNKNRNKSIVCCFLFLLLLCHFSALAGNVFHRKQAFSEILAAQNQKPPIKINSNIAYQADSLIKQDLLNNSIELFKNARLSFEDIKLSAGYILLNSNTGLVIARGVYDQKGVYGQKPVFEQNGQESVQDSINFNFKTKKAKVWNVVVDYQDLVIKGATNKVENDSVLYFEDIRFTTSRKEKPDYFIKTNKAKYIKDKLLITGFSQLYIADVPTPIVLPFAYIPLSKGRNSGFLVPTWGESREQGYFLQNGGYYFAINEKIDLALTGDIYTNGSWGIKADSNYKRRYKHSGNIEIIVENLIESSRGLSDFSKTTNYNLRWSHNQDAKSNPNARLSASVNLGSSSFFRQSLNELTSDSFLNNTLNSSITYFRTFQGTPFNATATFTNNQNTNTGIINMTLPSLQVNAKRIFPFAGKTTKKDNLLQKTGVTYTFQAENSISTNDDDFLTSKMFEDSEYGIQQNIDISTNFKAFKHFALSPSMNFKEVWYFDQIKRRFDTGLNTEVTETLQKFSAFRDFSADMSFTTTFYGLYQFKKGPYSAVLHTMIPRLSYSFRPDLSSIYNKKYQASADPNNIQSYSPFEDGIYGSPNSSTSNNLGINITNNFEAKLSSKDKNNRKPSKKVTLINNLNLSSSYNISADSLRWSPWNVNSGLNLFKKKLSVNLKATLDPYTIDSSGARINQYTLKNGRGLFRVTRAGLDMSTSFSSSEIFGKQSSRVTGKSDDKKDINLFNYKIPWTLKLDYTLDYANSNRQNEISSHTLDFSGDLELTPKWSVAFSSGYDFRNKGFAFTTLNFTRDLDSWKMNFNWVPFGDRETYYFFIGVKSPLLSDLKFDRRGLPDNNVF